MDPSRRRDANPRTPPALGWLALAATLALIGCGGGGDGTAVTDANSADAATAGTPLPTATGGPRFSGTAATGAAMAGATLRFVCARGVGPTVTTDGEGRFATAAADVGLPCIVQARSADGVTVLHSLVASDAAAAEVTVNVSPLTELVAAQALGQRPAAAIDASPRAEDRRLLGAALAVASQAVLARLREAGLDTGPLGAPISDPLRAASPRQAGDAHDVVLDALRDRLLAAGSSVGQLADALLAAAAPPARQWLQPVAPDCAALRSGSFRWVGLEPLAGGWSERTLEVDAPALTVRDGERSLVGKPIEPCRYAHTDAESGERIEMMVAAGGALLTHRQTAAGARGLGVAFVPAPVTMAELAGDWNVAGWRTGPDGHVHVHGTLAIDGVGQLLDERACSLSECVAAPPAVARRLLPAADGVGFELDEGDAARRPRVHALRGARGEASLIWHGAAGLFVATRSAPLPLPAEGSVVRRFEVALDPQLGVGPVTASSHRHSGVDATRGIYVRSDEANGVARAFTVNEWRPGLVYGRPGVSSKADPITRVLTMYGWGELVGTPLPGLGLTVFATRESTAPGSAGQFGLALERP